MQKKVYVGLSGGVDSSVAAALLQEQGYDVVGVFIKVWHPDFMPCEWPEERRSAMRAAAALNIPFKTLDLEAAYKKEVVDYMIEEYRQGRTPNPDVMCNKYVKFGGFLEYAREHGADYVATGHYAIRIDNPKTNAPELHEGRDSEKDQSYFLWTMKSENLPQVLFPVGEYEKHAVRKLATKFGLPTADKKDSQGLCFLGKVDMKEFLKHFIESVPGNVLSEDGAVIGTHDGAVFYTIGQRHGFTLADKNTDRTRMYVVAKDNGANTITVSSSYDKESYAVKQVLLSSANWISGERPAEGKYEARIRYRGKREVCTLEHKGDATLIDFGTPLPGLAYGQSCVLYSESNCLGGGIMEPIS